MSAQDLAKSNLRSSRAQFEQVIGHEPGQLAHPAPAMSGVPKSVQETETLAMEQSPSVVEAVFQERAAAHVIDRIIGELLPTVDLEAQYSNRFEPSDGTDQRETASIIGRLIVPFYQGGGVYARIRQARRIREQRHSQIEDARRRARADAITAWSTLLASRARLRSDNTQTRASRTALNGVRAEERVGQRSVLDVLDAEQELLNAQVAMATTQRDIVVASYTVLSVIGRLTAGDMQLASDLHDAEVYYGAVRTKAWGTRIVRDESYDGYVVLDDFGNPYEQQRGGGLIGDVRRMSEDARTWVTEEITR